MIFGFFIADATIVSGIEIESVAAARDGGGGVDFGFLNASRRVRLIGIRVVRPAIEKRTHTPAKQSALITCPHCHQLLIYSF